MWYVTPQTVVDSWCYPHLGYLLVHAGIEGVEQEGRVVLAGLQLLCSHGQESVEPVHSIFKEVKWAWGGEDVAMRWVEAPCRAMMQARSEVAG